MEWKFGISRCKLLQRERINNKVLRYSTGNHHQYPVINHNGKEYEKEYICVSVTEQSYSFNEEDDGADEDDLYCQYLAKAY